MSDTLTFQELIRNRRIAQHAAAKRPAWLWTHDGQRLVWANPPGIEALRNGVAHAVAVEIARVSSTTPAGTKPRLIRLRGLAGPLEPPKLCSCEWVTVGAEYMLVVAADAEASMTLDAQLKQLLPSQEAAAAFSVAGDLVYAPPAGGDRLREARSLAQLGADELHRDALENGLATGPTAVGPVTVIRIGADSFTALLVFWDSAPAQRGASDEQARDDAAALLRPTQPLRFVWRIDADGLFVIESQEFVQILGPLTAAKLGRPWNEVAQGLALDPGGRIAAALATHDTWSGIKVDWPIDGATKPLTVEMSGLPMFDPTRRFAGYRGFGVCRDVARAVAIVAERNLESTAATPAARDARTVTMRAASGAAPAAAFSSAPNVVPFRAMSAGEARGPALSAGERNAFHELARELAARLRAPAAAPEPDPLAMATDAETTATANHATAGDAFATTPRDRAFGEVLTSASAEVNALDRLPFGILIYRLDRLLYANAMFLDWTGFRDLNALDAAGGLDALFVASRPCASEYGRQPVTVSSDQVRQCYDGYIAPIQFEGENAMALFLVAVSAAGPVLSAASTQRAADDAETKRLENALADAARRADQAVAAQSALIARLGQELRTPLNSIVGFAQLIIDGAGGPVENARQLSYLHDIRACGEQAAKALNDLTDIATVEAGALDLSFTRLDLNGAVRQGVALMQPYASEHRIIIRVALTSGLPLIVADARALRQIVMGLLSAAVHTAGAGGQVIVSTAQDGHSRCILRVRMTGSSVEPSRWPVGAPPTDAAQASAGGGLSLALTKALADANRAAFRIASKSEDGALIEIAFVASHAATESGQGTAG